MRNLNNLVAAGQAGGQNYANRTADRGGFAQVVGGYGDFLSNVNKLEQNQQSLSNMKGTLSTMGGEYAKLFDDPNIDPAVKQQALDRYGELSMVAGMTNLNNINNFGDNFSKIVKTKTPASVLSDFKLQEIKNNAILQAAGIQANARIKASENAASGGFNRIDYQFQKQKELEQFKRFQDAKGRAGTAGVLSGSNDYSLDLFD